MDGPGLGITFDKAILYKFREYSVVGLHGGSSVRSGESELVAKERRKHLDRYCSLFRLT
jgi:hypothetical protein